MVGMWDLEAVHRHCSHNRRELAESQRAGCFYCVEILSPEEIGCWIDGGETAICPHCPVDSVIGDTSGFPITMEFLEAMRRRWFF